jgi:hypothetical protein
MTPSEREERDARWRQQCRDLAEQRARKGLERLEAFLAGGDPLDLDRAARLINRAQAAARMRRGVIG